MRLPINDLQNLRVRYAGYTLKQRSLQAIQRSEPDLDNSLRKHSFERLDPRKTDRISLLRLPPSRHILRVCLSHIFFRLAVPPQLSY